MTKRTQNAILVYISVEIDPDIGHCFLKRFQFSSKLPLTIVGSVIKQDPDIRNQSPIADVEIITSPATATGVAKE